MSPLVRKEIRLVFPYWGIAMLLVIVLALVLARDMSDPLNKYFTWGFDFGMVLLGLAPFGYEFSTGTFSSLMVQPMERRRIWRLKILVTGLAALLAVAAFECILYWRMQTSLTDWRHTVLAKFPTPNLRISGMLTEQQDLFWPNFWHISRSVILVPFVAITGGLWATLLFRQTGAALWFVILVPGAISVALIPVAHWFNANSEETIGLIAFALYSVAGFLWARRMFANAQDYQWLGESIAVFDLKSAKVHDDSAAPRRRAAIRALVRKEIQSHQISLLIAFGLLVMHICSLVIRGVYVLPRNSEFRFVVEAVPYLWLLVPWLVGSVAIAEERKLGTAESQLCLPLRRRTQFAIKLIIALVLGIVLGGVIPSAIEWIGLKFHIGSEMLGLVPVAHSSEVVRQSGSNLAGMGAFAVLCIIATLISIVSVFASSLTRNTLHALGAAVVFGFGWILLYRSLFFQYDQSWWHGQLIFLIGILFAVATTIALSFSNYKILYAGRNVWLRNVVVLFITMVCAGIATAVIYQRPWELVVSVEPRHGAAVLSGPVQPMVRMPQGKIFALLPDGRIWTATGYVRKEVGFSYQSWNGNTQQYEKVNVDADVPTGGTFIEGSNWTAIAGNAWEINIAGLRSDGTLWEFRPRNSESAHRQADWLSGVPEPRRLGLDSDWKTVVAGQGCFYAIKTNGTLWGWGYLPYLAHSSFIEEPAQIGTNSDWSKLFSLGEGLYVMKTNGQVFGQVAITNSLSDRFGRIGRNGADWLSIAGDYRLMMIHQDGTLWAGPGQAEENYFGVMIPANNEDVRVGNASDWKQIVGSKPNLFALKKDGRLVKDQNELFSSFLGRFSRNSDWLAAAAQWNQVVALAADGTICEWYDARGWGDGQLLAPTRRPLWSINILKDAKN
jgi:hypothetical protein